MADTFTAPLPGWMPTTSTMIGTPDADADWWPGPATVQDSCGIESAQYILEQFTHIPIDEKTLANEAIQDNLFDPKVGMHVSDIQELLQLHGIPTEATVGDISTIESQLADGHKVIAFVDAGALDPGAPEGGHFVVVDGVDLSDPNNPQVIISDPYTTDAEDRHSLAQFQHAWDWSGDQMLSTDIAPPVTAPTTEQPDLPYPQDMSGFTWPPEPVTPGSLPADPSSVLGGTDHSTLTGAGVDPAHDYHALC